MRIQLPLLVIASLLTTTTLAEPIPNKKLSPPPDLGGHKPAPPVLRGPGGLQCHAAPHTVGRCRNGAITAEDCTRICRCEGEAATCQSGFHGCSLREVEDFCLFGRARCECH